MSKRIAAVGMSAVVAFTGCSWTQMRMAPTVDPGYRPVPCDTRTRVVEHDLLWGIIFGGLGVILVGSAIAGADDSSAGTRVGIAAGGATLTGVGVAFFWSMSDGMRSVKRCRTLNAPANDPGAPE